MKFGSILSSYEVPIHDVDTDTDVDGAFAAFDGPDLWRSQQSVSASVTLFNNKLKDLYF